jgi:hypothetical protein
MPIRQADLFTARVVNIYPETRLIDVEWIDTDTIKHNVQVIQTDGNYALPHKGEIGAIIGSDASGYYYLGKVDFGYASKLNKQVTIPNTKINWPVKKVQAGEVYISHVLNGLGLLFSNSGNFSLTAKNQDGIKYIKNILGEPFRWLQSYAKSILLSSVTSGVKIGAAIREIAVQGEKIIRSNLDPTKAAQEFLVEVGRTIAAVPRTVIKFHLGEIFNEPIANPFSPIPTPNANTGGGLLRALLSIFDDAAGATELAALKIDNTGGVEIKGTKTIVMDALTIYLGSIFGASTEPAVLGQQLSNWLATHTHATGTGPSGVPNEVADLPSTLSTKIFVS